ncbi:SRPBCC family protein [Nocardioides sp. W3-2-3]|uniref:SRPBCC family protein n=1 Tax=Nocardioides convexus TaxID=2712224 RepID=UPI0024181F0E|nr:SRPBCC family protein [Nocardioides convexus]NGZ99937.1 SRPBCC family protein [Nocardioides convexus]
MLVTATGPASVEDAWQRYVLPALWPLWAPQIRTVRLATGTPDDPLVPGVRGTVLGPPPLRVPFRILAADDAGHRWAWRVGLGPLGVTMEHGVDPGPAAVGCTAWVRIRLPGPLAAPYAPLARLALRRLVAG